MFQYLFDSIPGIEIYAILSLFFFITFFIAILYWMIRMDKDYIKKVSQLPLDSIQNQEDPYHD